MKDREEETEREGEQSIASQRNVLLCMCSCEGMQQIRSKTAKQKMCLRNVNEAAISLNEQEMHTIHKLFFFFVG